MVLEGPRLAVGKEAGHGRNPVVESAGSIYNAIMLTNVRDIRDHTSGTGEFESSIVGKVKTMNRNLTVP